MKLRLAALSALVCGITALPTVAQNAPAGAPTHVAVVNVSKVLSSMQEFKDIRAKWEADQSSMKTLADKDQADLASEQQNIVNGPKPGTDQYDQAVQTFDKDHVEDESQLQLKKLQFQRGQSRTLKMLFEEIEASVADVAKEKGFDLVITEASDFPPNVQDLTPDAMAQLMAQHNVMYVTPQIDISSEVITVLDAKYKSGNTSTGGAPAGGK